MFGINLLMVFKLLATRITYIKKALNKRSITLINTDTYTNT
ncbi:hypothetical protein CZ797_14755 [Pseudoalteromonas sp. JB197]|nr:hypothetical protein CZ797_14755 [Pseudoalteromonas sp. JB197]